MRSFELVEWSNEYCTYLRGCSLRWRACTLFLGSRIPKTRPNRLRGSPRAPRCAKIVARYKSVGENTIFLSSSRSLDFCILVVVVKVKQAIASCTIYRKLKILVTRGLLFYPVDAKLQSIKATRLSFQNFTMFGNFWLKCHRSTFVLFATHILTEIIKNIPDRFLTNYLQCFLTKSADARRGRRCQTIRHSAGRWRRVAFELSYKSQSYRAKYNISCRWHLRNSNINSRTNIIKTANMRLN